MINPPSMVPALGEGQVMYNPGFSGSPMSAPGLQTTGSTTIPGSVVPLDRSLPSLEMLTAAAQYIEAVSLPTASADPAGPLPSLAGVDQGLIGDYLKRGEQAMRLGRYSDAFSLFQQANDLNKNGVESLLSLVHARFAMVGTSSYQASFYLQKAIRYLPELPLTKLEPKKFFPSADVYYTEHISRLTKYLAGNPADPDGFFLLAYFTWFDSDYAGAQDALALAKRAAENDELIEAIDIFWDGMLASGLVEGDLVSNGALAARGIFWGSSPSKPPASPPPQTP